jgi:hypothetical protein
VQFSQRDLYVVYHFQSVGKSISPAKCCISNDFNLVNIRVMRIAYILY